MLRKFSKKNPSAKQSKRGVILVTILFILAISFILITAAMLMTKGTRDRLYARAESSQARLTATAVAQSFYQAYWDQTLTEGALSTILSSNRAGNPLKIYASGEDLPGLTQSTDNCTTLTVVPNPADTTSYFLDFKTTIGTETSTVRLSLKPVNHGSSSGTFQHQLQLGSGGRLENVVVGCEVVDSDQYNNTSIHMYSTPNDNNTVLSLGGSTSWGGQTHIASTLYCDSTLGSGSNTQMYGDVIFFGNSSGINLHGTSGSSFAGHNTNLYFLNSGGNVTWYDNTRIDSSNISTYTTYDPANPDLNISNDWIVGFNDVVFYNSSMYVDRNQNIHQSQHYYTNVDGNITCDPGAQAKWDELEANYADVSSAVSRYLSKISAGHYDAAPDSLDRPNNKTYNDFIGDANLSFLANPSAIGGTDFPTAPGATLNPGTYILGAGSAATQFNIGNGNTCTCNLNSGRYVFIVKGDFTFKTGQLVFTGGNIMDPSHSAYFVILGNASLRFEPYNVTDSGVTYPTGIVSANCFSSSDYQRPNIVQTAKPSVMVLGAGCTEGSRCLPSGTSDHVSDGQIYYDGNQNECILTAYVNLLPTSAPSTNYGSVCGNRGGNCCIFYGRLYCNQCYGGNGSCLVMPYCPAPDDVNTNGFIPYEHDYEAAGFSYYTT